MRSRGTTLLETLIALAATVIVLAGLAGTVLGARTARVRTTAVADRTAALRTTILRLAAEIEAAHAVEIVPAAAGAPLGAPTLRLDLPGGGVAWAVRTEPGDGVRSALARGATDAPGCPRAGTAPVAGLPILSAVRAFRLRAFDGTTWFADWPPGRLPRAIEVTLGVDDGAGRVVELGTVVRLPVGGVAT